MRQATMLGHRLLLLHENCFHLNSRASMELSLSDSTAAQDATTRLTVFANFRIDSAERLQRMEDSFDSFRSATIAQWVVNIRGPEKEAARRFLQSRLQKEELALFDLESRRGWFNDSRAMLAKIDGAFVLFWLEDHIFTAPATRLDQIVAEMATTKSEYLEYSWFHPHVAERGYRGIKLKEGSSIRYGILGLAENEILQRNFRSEFDSGVYILSAAAIFDSSLFRRLILGRPLIRRWSKFTPFDFEKRWDDVRWLPIRFALSKSELFACIDDDNLHSGTCLISRGLYPERLPRDALLVYRSPLYVRRIKAVVARVPVLAKAIKFLYQKARQIAYQF